MIDISVQNIIKAFEEGNNILDGITFDINAGERVGLLGKNGAGKTTLLKLITGELTEDEGSIVISPSRKLGYVSQIPIFPKHFLVEDVLRSAFDTLFELRAQMERLTTLMESGSESADILTEYDKHAFDFERLGGYIVDAELARVANGLSIPQEQRRQRFETLSGGERTRINLARLILENTDILLLDEPTNHLDLNATMWLEEFLSKFKGTVVVISHDRYFLDKTINRVVEINNGKAEFYSGNYSYYVAEKQRRFEEQFEKYEREQAEARRLNASADRLQQWGVGNRKLMKKSFAIRTRAERAVKTEKPDKDREIRGKFRANEFRADEVLLIKGLTKSYGGKTLIDIDELLVQGKERIAIIGDNGTGKTTLVKMIVGGGITPPTAPDAGFARLGPSVKCAYLPQIVEFQNPQRSILDTLIYEMDISMQMARNRLGAYLFAGDDVYKQVSDLSGGEKSRLRLCMLMNDGVNLLILDEPTNHLDLQSREWLEDAIADYDESLIFISHDRYFINKFATRIWEISNGRLTDYRGSYEKFIAAKADEINKKRADSAQSGAKKEKPPSPKSKPSERQKEIRQLERTIDKLERELEAVKAEKDIHATDYEKLLELGDREREASHNLEYLLEQWTELQS